MNNGDHISAYRWMLAIVALVGMLFAFSRLRVGYTILYYLATLTLLFILLTQYQGVAWVLNPFTPSDQQAANTATKQADDAAKKAAANG